MARLASRLQQRLEYQAELVLGKKIEAFRKNLRDRLRVLHRQFFRMFAEDIARHGPSAREGEASVYRPGGGQLPRGAPPGNMTTSWRPLMSDYLKKRLEEGSAKHFVRGGGLIRSLLGNNRLAAAFEKRFPVGTYRVAPLTKKNTSGHYVTKVVVRPAGDLGAEALQSIRKNLSLDHSKVTSTDSFGDRSFLESLLPRGSGAGQVLYRLGNFGSYSDPSFNESLLPREQHYGRTYRPALEFYALYWLKAMPRRAIAQATQETFRKR